MSESSTTIRSFFLNGPAGRLESLLNAGAPTATHAAVVCHPHPLFGGTLHNKVVFHAMKALNSFGFPVLRFNFRGAGLSAGQHDHGRAEVEDVRCAFEWLEHEFHLPVVFAGFSFGAAVGLRAACPDERVKAAIALGLPVSPSAGRKGEERSYDFTLLERCTKPKLFISGSRDEFAPREELEQAVRSFADPKTLVMVEGADHFFDGHLKEMRRHIEDWVNELYRNF